MYINTWPSCSKLTMSLFNLSLKLLSLNMVYMLICLLKKCELLLATHIFSAKITVN